LSQRALVVSAIAANVIAAAASYAMFGWTGIGAHVAARWTARFSVLMFIAALAQPGLTRWMATLPSYATLLHTFVAAHCVHFAAVATVLFLDKDNHFVKNPGPAAAIIGIGFSVVIISGLTAARRSTLAKVVNEIATLFVFGIFFLAFARHHFMPLRAISVLLVIALILRIIGVLQGRAVKSAAATAA
jgi:hypothetical protein